MAGKCTVTEPAAGQPTQTPAPRPCAGQGEPLALAHGSLIEPLLAALDVPLSEYSFANLYLFRAVHDYRVRLDPIPHVLGVTYDGVRHAMPLVGCGRREIEMLLEHAACLYPLTQEMALEAAACAGVVAHWNEDDSDYTYDARRLASLAGTKLKDKRREAAAFEARARPYVEPLGSVNRHHAYEILERWTSQVARSKAQTDYDACREALDHQEALGMCGMLVLDDMGRPCAFLLARRIGKNGMAVHFAKGNRDYDGVYPYLFSRFAATAGASWLNFEQDLGKPGLRQAKRALDPVRQLRKLRLSWERP
jgi:hypothetical protein